MKTAREVIQKVRLLSTYGVSLNECELAELAFPLARMLEKAIEGITEADKHCEAIALSSLLPPMEVGGYDGGFFERQATKSVGSGGRAHYILKDTLKKLDAIAASKDS